MLGRTGGRGGQAEWEKRPSYWGRIERELNTRRRDGKKSHRKRLAARAHTGLLLEISGRPTWPGSEKHHTHRSRWRADLHLEAAPSPWLNQRPQACRAQPNRSRCKEGGLGAGASPARLGHMHEATVRGYLLLEREPAPRCSGQRNTD